MASRRLRSLLSVAGIGLGAALLFAAIATDQGIEQSIQRMATDQVGRSSLRVTAFEEGGLSTAAVDAVRGIGGVAAVAPAVERQAFAQAPGRPNLGAVDVVGIDPRAETQVHDFALSSGVFLGPNSGRSIVLPAQWALEHHVGMGESVTFADGGGEFSFQIVGLLDASGEARTNGGQVAFIGLGDAQQLFALDGRVTRLDVRLTDGANLGTVETAVVGAMDGEHYLLTRSADVVASLRAQVADFRGTTILLAALGLFVGGFLIYNTLSASVADRIREIGLLRVAGASRGQIYRLVLREGLLLGAVGSALGLLLGLGAANLLASFVRATQAAQIDSPSISPAAAVFVFGVGLFVTLAATVRPAERAAGIAPVDALRSRAPQQTQLDPRRIWMLGLNLALAVAALGLWPLLTDGDGAEMLVRPYLIFGLLLGAVLVSPWLFAPLGRLVAVPFTRMLPAEGRIARGDFLRERGRSVVTIGALMVGMAMIVAVAMLAYNARQAGDAWVEPTLPGQAVVRALAPVPLDFADDFRSVAGVASVTPIRAFDIDVGGSSVDAAAIDPSAYEAAGSLDFVAGDRATAFGQLMKGGAVLIPASAAGARGITLGSTVVARTSGGDHPFTVAGIVAHSFPGATSEALLFGWKDAQDVFGYTDATLFAVRAAPGTSPAALADALRTVAEPLALQVYTVAQIGKAIEDQLNRVFGLFDALALVTLLVAALAIANTLFMSVSERTREFGILRAAGMSRGGLRRMILVEGWMIGLVGGLLGIASGLLVGVALLLLSRAPGFQPPFAIPWAALGWTLILGLATSIFAAYYPAQVAGNIPIARAVRQH